MGLFSKDIKTMDDLLLHGLQDIYYAEQQITKGESGKDFSSDFDSMQVSAHKDAVSLFERYAKGGDNAELKNWAGKTLPTLKHHLEMAQDLGKSRQSSK